MNCCIHSGGVRNCMHAGKGGVLQLVARSLQRRHLSIAMMIAFYFSSLPSVLARSQEQPITISVKNATLETIFAEIRKQTGINFIYTKDLLQRTSKVSIDVRNESLQRVMELIMKDQPLSYTVLDEYVVIKKKPVPELNTIIPDKEVRGKVTNNKGEAVMGATVAVKDSRNITFTDEGGVFILRNVSAGAVIQITSVGYDSREVVAQVNEPLVVLLQQKANVLVPVAVVINTGYQTVSKEKMVGAYSQLDSAAFHRRAGMDILGRLDGTVTGMMFNRVSKAAPITIRGISTTGMNQGDAAFSPLIILDNFPYTGNIDNINPNDVKDITVLKDAAAASIWGSRAGNGVIVITTKKGSYNQPFQLTVTTNFGFTEKPDIWYAPIMNSADFIDAESFLYSKGYYNSALNNKSSRPVISPVVELLKRRDQGLINAADATAKIDQLRGLDLRDQLDKYIYRVAAKQQYHVNMSGGSDKMNYAVSIGYDNVHNNVRGSKPDVRYTINSNTVFRPLRSFELTMGIQYTQAINKSVEFNPKLPPGGGKSTIYPYAQLADENGNALPIAKDYRAGYTDTAGKGKLLDWKYRPLDEIRNASYTMNDQFLRIDMGASWRFRELFRIDLKYQYTSQDVEVRDYKSIETYFARNLINRFSALDATGNIVRNIPLGGILDLNDTRNTMHNARAQASFRDTWHGGHELNTMVAAEIGETKGNFVYARLFGYDDEMGTYATNIDFNSVFQTYGNVGGSSKIGMGLSEGNSLVNRFVSLLANASYSYQGKYLLHASARRDGANVFGVHTNNKWKPLWSAGIAWDVLRENFFDLAWLNSLKFRVAIGSMGNVSLMRSGVPSIIYTTPAQLTGLPTAIAGEPPNADLKWEDVKTINIGLDFSVLNGRLTGTVEWFRKRSTDLISTMPVDPTSGVDRFVVNSADLQGKGIDINLNSVNFRGAITWESAFGMSYNKTIVRKFYNPAGNNAISLFLPSDINPVEGQIAWGLASYKWAGLDPENGDPRGFLRKEISKNYNALSLDSVQNQVFHGSSIPLYSGFLLNTIRYKGFSLSLNILYRLDYYYRLSTISYSALGSSWISHSDYQFRWKSKGDENTTTVPSFTYPLDGFRNNFYAYSEVNVRRADNIKVQDVRLCYQWSRKSAGFPIQKAQVYAYLNNLNLFLWRRSNGSQFPDIDPLGLRTQRTITLGTIINF